MTDVTPDTETDNVDAVEADTVEETPEKRYEFADGSSVYVDGGNTHREARDGSLYVVEGDVYDHVVALASLFPDKF